MAIATQTMTDEQRKSVALEYLKRLDLGKGVIALFDDGACVYFPKWGVAKGIDQIKHLFTDLMGILTEIEHHSEYFNYVVQGDVVVVEGCSRSVTADGRQDQAGDRHRPRRRPHAVLACAARPPRRGAPDW